MELIPVIDLMNGTVVQAVRGFRQNYLPVRSVLCDGSDPIVVINSLLSLFPFKTIYIADLDALTGRGDQFDLVRSIQENYRDLEIWVDAGMPFRRGKWVPVIGSESLDEASWEGVKANRDWILSLDFFQDSLKGAEFILSQPEAWPQRVIVMDLDRVGSFQGTSHVRLETIAKLAPDRQLIAAGGIRNLFDLEQLADLGIGAALLASALHSGRITAVDLNQWAT